MSLPDSPGPSRRLCCATDGSGWADVAPSRCLSAVVQPRQHDHLRWDRNPAKLDRGAGAARRRGISPAFLSRPSVNATEPGRVEVTDGPVFAPDWRQPAPTPGPGVPEPDLSVQLSAWMLLKAAATAAPRRRRHHRRQPRPDVTRPGPPPTRGTLLRRLLPPAVVRHFRPAANGVGATDGDTPLIS
jgi:hypothetical protein